MPRGCSLSEVQCIVGWLPGGAPPLAMGLIHRGDGRKARFQDPVGSWLWLKETQEDLEGEGAAIGRTDPPRTGGTGYRGGSAGN